MSQTNHSERDHTLLSADWVLPVTTAPVLKGGLVVAGSRIAAVGPAETLSRAYPHAVRRPLRGHVLMPGLVNAHTHLELTLLKDRVAPGDDFVSWILRLIAEKKAMSEAAVEASVRTGLEECLASGTTCLGEISNTPHSLRMLREAGVRGVVFHEILGRPTGDLQARIDYLHATIKTMRATCGEQLVVGVSPHSPYTLSPELFSHLATYLHAERLPYAIHLAESQDEMDYFLHHRGALKERLFPAVGWDSPSHPEPAGSPLAHLDGFGLLTPRLLAVHGVHLTPQEITRMGNAGAALALCPRSNDTLRVGRAPLAAMLSSGIPVSLGTDSLASNRSLSLWDEMRFLRKCYGDPDTLSPAHVIRMATLDGARALGLAASIGSLEAGKEADLIAVRTPDPSEGDPTEALIEKTGSAALGLAMVAGRTLIDRIGR
jgi:cytosine/adenosine deaminase-related metal-dependent hydrolase